MPHRTAFLASLFLTALRSRPGLAQTTVTPAYVFSWFSSDDGKTIHPCSIDTFTNVGLPDPPEPPVPPYYLITYPAENTPQVIAAGPQGNVNWTANYPSVTSLLIGMVDSKGNSGGIANPYNLQGTIPTGQNCTGPPAGLGTITWSGFSTGDTPQTPQCGSVSLSFVGGTPPYTLTVARVGSIPVNITGIKGSPYTWTNTIQTGGEAMLALSDATGQYFKTSQIFTSGVSADSACLAGSNSGGTGGGGGGTSGGSSDGGSDDSKHSSSGKYIGIGVGAAVVIIGALAGVFWYLRKKRQDGDGVSGIGAAALGKGYGGEKPGYGGRPQSTEEERAHLSMPNGGYGGYNSSSAASTSETFPPSELAYAGYAPSSQSHAPATSASPHSAYFAGNSNRVSMASSSGTHGGGGVTAYPPMPPMPMNVPQPPAGQPSGALTGFRIANPDRDHEAGPSSGNRRLSLGAGNALNQDYQSKTRPQGDLPGANRYNQTKDFEDTEPNFEDDMPPVYRDRRNAAGSSSQQRTS